MDEQQVQDLIERSLNSGQYDYGKVVYHAHTGADSPIVDIASVGRFPANPVNGDTVFYNNGQWNTLSIGSSGTVIVSNGSVPTYSYPGGQIATFVMNDRQAVSAGNAVIVGSGVNDFPGLTSQLSHGSSVGLDGTAAGWYGQSFFTDADATGINDVTMWFSRGNFANTSRARVSIRATTFSGGNYIPTGSDLGAGTTGLIAQNDSLALAVGFSPPITVTPSTLYAIIVRMADSGDNQSSVNYNNSAGGVNEIYYNSTDSGVTWTPSLNKAFYYSFNEQIDDLGKLGLATATGSSPTYYNNFVGFAQASGGSNATIPVTIGGINTNQSGLTVGSTYFLSNTPGAIATSAGTNSRKVGLSTATTAILVKFDNP